MGAGRCVGPDILSGARIRATLVQMTALRARAVITCAFGNLRVWLSYRDVEELLTERRGRARRYLEMGSTLRPGN